MAKTTIVDPFKIFRNDTAKAAIATELADGKFHAVPALKAVCAAHAAGDTQVYWTLKELETRGGHKVERKNDAVRVIKAKRAKVALAA